MKNQYKWDKKDLIKQLLELKYKKNTNHFNYSEAAMEEYYIDSLIEMIQTKKYNLNILLKYPYLLMPKPLLGSTIKDEVYDFSTKFQREIIKKSFSSINNSSKQTETNILNKKISIEEQISLIKKAFSKNSKLIKAHDKLFDPNYHLLNITRKHGEDIFFHTEHNGYISNKNDQTIKDFIALTHEIGHYDEFINTSGIIDKKMYLYDKLKINNYTEVYSIFYELLSVIILRDEGYINDNNKDFLLNYLGNININNIEYFLIAMNYLKNDKNININPVRLLTYSLSDLAMYYYSYIIAKKILNQYLEDPEKAFYNLNYLINNITPNNENKILRYCDINLHDFNKNL